MSLNNNDNEKEHIIVFGLGNFYKNYEEQINDKYIVDAYIDNGKEEKVYKGKDIIQSRKIQKYVDIKILIMLHSIQQCIDVAKELITAHNVNFENILLGHNLLGAYADEYDSMRFDKDGKICLTKNDIFLKVSSEDEFHNVREVFVDENYCYFINNNKQDVVIDIGMNIGDATLYFLNNKKVKKVYGYEPFKVTYEAACDNLKEYLKDSNRLETFQIGLSNKNEVREINFNQGMSCGQSTIVETREIAYKFYEQKKLISKNDEIKEKIQVRKASEIIGTIIECHKDTNIILKVDCEGEEYSIFQELFENKILQKIDFIMLEWHYKGKAVLLKLLEDTGFSYWCSNKNKDMGLIYAYRS